MLLLMLGLLTNVACSGYVFTINFCFVHKHIKALIVLFCFVLFVCLFVCFLKRGDVGGAAVIGQQCCACGRVCVCVCRKYGRQPE